MKFLIAGFGSIGRRHFRNLISLGEEEIIFYRTHQSTLEDDELLGYPVETSLKSALAHQPDAVIIANPTAYHLDVALPAAEQGCHILLEKPVSHSLEGVTQLRETAEQTGSRILVGFQFRYHPGLQQVREWIQSGELGRPYSVRAQWGEYLPDWHPWEDFRNSYSARKDLGGGVILTLSHPIDYLRWILGEFDHFKAVAGSMKILSLEVEELVEILVRFQTGTLGSVHLNYLQQLPVHSLEILAEKGIISWDGQTGMVKRYLNQEQSWVELPLPDGFTRNDLFLAEMRHFLKVISGEEAPGCSISDGIQVQKALAEIHRSLAQNGWER